MCSRIFSANSKPFNSGISISRMKISAILPSSISYTSIFGLENSLILNSICFFTENLFINFLILSISYLLSSQIDILSIFSHLTVAYNFISLFSVYIKKEVSGVIYE